MNLENDDPIGGVEQFLQHHASKVLDSGEDISSPYHSLWIDERIPREVSEPKPDRVHNSDGFGEPAAAYRDVDPVSGDSISEPIDPAVASRDESVEQPSVPPGDRQQDPGHPSSPIESLAPEGDAAGALPDMLNVDVHDGSAGRIDPVASAEIELVKDEDSIAAGPLLNEVATSAFSELAAADVTEGDVVDPVRQAEVFDSMSGEPVVSPAEVSGAGRVVDQNARLPSGELTPQTPFGRSLMDFDPVVDRNSPSDHQLDPAGEAVLSSGDRLRQDDIPVHRGSDFDHSPRLSVSVDGVEQHDLWSAPIPTAGVDEQVMAIAASQFSTNLARELSPVMEENRRVFQHRAFDMIQGSMLDLQRRREH